MMVYSEEPIWPIPHIPALYDDGDYGGKIMWEELGFNALYLFFLTLEHQTRVQLFCGVGSWNFNHETKISNALQAGQQ